MHIKHKYDFELTEEEKAGPCTISMFIRDIIYDGLETMTFVYGRTWQEPKGDLGVETLDKHSDF